MQLTGMQFTTESVFAGNDVSTFPDFPAEIRAPAGTLYGVSAFQLNFSSRPVFTPGDDLDALVVMNPASLKTNLGDLKVGGILIADRESFNDQNLKKAGYTSNPLENSSLDKYQLFPVDVTKLTTLALKDL
ncbi:MAG: 2-oxoacid:acceptor oxidoreductase family protein, partial [Deltaproteobacteria bacterium]|nr:2-oxoacid:acceptor oxidoreductase family protein [Deltaproteobacteria bacterium]